ncbi:MAG: riboflavin biosynthesis protein RibF [Eubacteriales bacterium]|nr:riboflavin biosynthesis protein RibF [Eubacteriales bacterium]MDD3882306.1 riboflavin biosynthesis protein RibF [Eubacteriales bacterium]MDD4512052.1 riboflavin biosynthesis protein RibF [Eubacteriales bacterium]
MKVIDGSIKYDPLKDMHMADREKLYDLSVIALGMFDGVHIGHRELLKKCARLGRRERVASVCVTFPTHPQTVLSGKPALTLQSLNQRLSCIARTGVTDAYLYPFDEKTAHMGALPYLRRLAHIFRPLHIVVGYNYTFGRGGEGTPDMLTEYAPRFGYRVHVIDDRTVDGMSVSATGIKRLLSAGDAEMASKMLGRPFEICGKIVAGKGEGRTMGFPTANVRLRADQFLPRFGVYAARAVVDGISHPAVLNLGLHPTLPEGGLTLEVNLLGERLELYGREAKIQFDSFLRPERKFADKAELEAQIAEDAAKASVILQNA